MVWIVASGPIDIDIKHTNIYCFEISCATCMMSFSKLLSIIGKAIIPHTLPLINNKMSSTLRKVVEAFVQLVPSVVNHSDHMLTF